METNCIRVMVVDDFPVVTDGLKAILDNSSVLEVVAAANSAYSMFPMLSQKNPDVILLDMNLPNENIETVVKQLKSDYTSIKTIAFTSYAPSVFNKEVKDNLDGYLVKDATFQEIEKAVVTVYNGNSYFKEDNSTSKGKTDNGDLIPDLELVNSLTKQEKLIIKYIVEGYKTKEMAELLHRSPNTISTHRRNIMAKTRCKSVGELIAFAHRNGLA